MRGCPVVAFDDERFTDLEFAKLAGRRAGFDDVLHVVNLVGCYFVRLFQPFAVFFSESSSISAWQFLFEQFIFQNL